MVSSELIHYATDFVLKKKRFFFIYFRKILKVFLKKINSVIMKKTFSFVS